MCAGRAKAARVEAEGGGALPAHRALPKKKQGAATPLCAVSPTYMVLHTHKTHAVQCVCLYTIGSTRAAVPCGAYQQAINELGLAAGDAEALLTEPLLELRDGESAQLTCRL